jgi:hypothetical protein
MTINPLPIYEDIVIMRSYTILEITTSISNYEVSMERRYACIRCTSGMAPPNTIPNTISNHCHNADTAQAVLDLSLAEQRSLKREMTVPESQQPLPRTLTVPEVQE